MSARLIATTALASAAAICGAAFLGAHDGFEPASSCRSRAKVPMTCLHGSIDLRAPFLRTGAETKKAPAARGDLLARIAEPPSRFVTVAIQRNGKSILSRVRVGTTRILGKSDLTGADNGNLEGRTLVSLVNAK